MSQSAEVFTPLEIASEQTEDGLIQGVLLCGNKSKNGYDIPPVAFGSEQRVKDLYDNTPVYFNHIAGNVRHPLARDCAGVCGVVRNARLINGRPYGDIEPYDSEQGRHLRNVIRSQPKNYGLSHIARYRFEKNKKSVAAIEEVFSVDVVLNPATTKSFRESKQSMEEFEIFKEQIAELKASVKGSEEKLTAVTQECEKLRESVKSLDEANVLLKSEKEELEKELGAFRAEKEKAEKLASIKTQCEEAKLPATAVTELFLESLLIAPSQESVDALIKERAELFGKVAPKTPVNAQQRQTPGTKEWQVSDALNEVKFA